MGRSDQPDQKSTGDVEYVARKGPKSSICSGSGVAIKKKEKKEERKEKTSIE